MQYDIIVRAASPPLRNDVHVEIHVVDVNDNVSWKLRYMVLTQCGQNSKFGIKIKQIFLFNVWKKQAPMIKNQFHVILNNYKDHFPVGPIGQIPAIDADISDKVSIHDFI